MTKCLADVHGFCAAAYRFDRVPEWWFSHIASGTGGGYPQRFLHIANLKKSRKSLATCSITELGFVRILAQLPEVDIPVTTSRELLATMKRERQFTKIADSVSALELPVWVQNPKQIADGHLLALAQLNGHALATCEKAIPGAFLIS